MRDRLRRLGTLRHRRRHYRSDSFGGGMDVRSRTVLSIVSCQLSSLAWDRARLYLATDDLPHDGWQLGLLTRRLFESGSRTVPLMLLLMTPVLIGIPHLYIWSHADAVAKSHVLQHKALYLNTPRFSFGPPSTSRFGCYLCCSSIGAMSQSLEDYKGQRTGTGGSCLHRHVCGSRLGDVA